MVQFEIVGSKKIYFDPQMVIDSKEVKEKLRLAKVTITYPLLDQIDIYWIKSIRYSDILEVLAQIAMFGLEWETNGMDVSIIWV